MKLQELKMLEWDGSVEEVCIIGNEKILLLHLENLTGLIDEGRRNLVKIDNDNNIIWVVEAPKIGRSIGWFKEGFKIENNNLVGWYGGSVFVKIDPSTGRIIEETFKPW